MKKFALSSALIISGCLAMVGCAQTGSVSKPHVKKTTKMHQHGVKKGHYDHAKHHQGKGHWKNGKVKGPLAQLNLTENQQNQIQAIQQAHAEQLQKNKNLNKAQRKKMVEQRILAIDKVLTPAQREQLKQMAIQNQSKYRKDK